MNQPVPDAMRLSTSPFTCDSTALTRQSLHEEISWADFDSIEHDQDSDSSEPELNPTFSDRKRM